MPWMFHRLLDRRFGDFVKGDALGFGFVKSKDFRQMPTDRFSFAVLVSRQVHFISFGRGFFSKAVTVFLALVGMT